MKQKHFGNLFYKTKLACEQHETKIKTSVSDNETEQKINNIVFSCFFIFWPNVKKSLLIDCGCDYDAVVVVVVYENQR